MATMNVSLPDPMKVWVEEQIAGGKYSSASDYVRDLIRRDQEYREKVEALRQAIREGEESGVSQRSIDDILNDARVRAQSEFGHG